MTIVARAMVARFRSLIAKPLRAYSVAEFSF